MDGQERVVKTGDGDTYAALIRARAQSQSRANFLAQMSHELRAPPVTVQGYADILISQKKAAIQAKVPHTRSCAPASGC